MTSRRSRPRVTKESREGALARLRLLDTALGRPNRMSTEWTKACASQGSLAALNLPKEGIVPVSLNTLKKAADLAIEQGGWQELDKKRKTLLHLVISTRIERRERKRNSAAGKVAMFEAQLSQERRARVVLNRAYVELYKKFEALAENDSNLARQLERHAATFAVPQRLEVVEKSAS